MELTIKFISEQFSLINSRHFNNELRTPRFVITNVRSYLGQCEGGRYGIGIIRISRYYDRSEQDIIDTIAHEMIHLYINQNHITDTRPHHGRVFYSIADRLNREGGFHISRCSSIVGCGVNGHNKEYNVCCFKLGREDKYFCFAMSPKSVDYYKRLMEDNPLRFVNPFMFVTTDDKTYAHYHLCRNKIRGYYITREEFDRLRQTESLIANFQTLGIKHDAA